MSARNIGLLLLLVGSEAIGLALGEWFSRLFKQAMPPAAVSAFNQGTTHAAYLVYGALAGLVIFAWALLAVLMSPLFRGKRAEKPS